MACILIYVIIHGQVSASLNWPRFDPPYIVQVHHQPLPGGLGEDMLPALDLTVTEAIADCVSGSGVPGVTGGVSELGFVWLRLKAEKCVCRASRKIWSRAG